MKNYYLIHELEDGKKKEINQIINIEEPLLNEDNNEAKKENKDIKGTPVIGIITLEDLIEFWLKIHILDEENYEKGEKEKNKKKKSRKLSL